MVTTPSYGRQFVKRHTIWRTFQASNVWVVLVCNALKYFQYFRCRSLINLWDSLTMNKKTKQNEATREEKLISAHRKFEQKIKREDTTYRG